MHSQEQDSCRRVWYAARFKARSVWLHPSCNAGIRTSQWVSIRDGDNQWGGARSLVRFRDACWSGLTLIKDSKVLGCGCMEGEKSKVWPSVSMRDAAFAEEPSSSYVPIMF